MIRKELLNDPETALRTALDGRQARMWTALPGILQVFDPSTMTCVVQPSIMGTILNEDGSVTKAPLPLLLDVPIVFPGCSTFIMTFPLLPGDEVLVIFASRCIDSWFQSGGIGLPMEARMHDLSDGFAIPGPRSLPHVVTGISATNVELRDIAGITKISIAPTGMINMTAPSGLNVTGNLTITGNVVATGEVTAGIIPLSTHQHSGVIPGGGTSGPPIP